MQKKTISRDVPLSEITLRKYEKPDFKGRDLIRKLCLSLGLLQPGDSRDVIVDILSVLLSSKKEVPAEEIEKLVIEQRKQHNLPLLGIASSNIRRQLKRLKDLHLIENIKNQYRVTEFEEPATIFKKHIKEFHLKNILERVEEHFEAIK